MNEDLLLLCVASRVSPASCLVPLSTKKTCSKIPHSCLGVGLCLRGVAELKLRKPSRSPLWTMLPFSRALRKGFPRWLLLKFIPKPGEKETSTRAQWKIRLICTRDMGQASPWVW